MNRGHLDQFITPKFWLLCTCGLHFTMSPLLASNPVIRVDSLLISFNFVKSNTRHNLGSLMFHVYKPKSNDIIEVFKEKFFLCSPSCLLPSAARAWGCYFQASSLSSNNHSSALAFALPLFQWKCYTMILMASLCTDGSQACLHHLWLAVVRNAQIWLVLKMFWQAYWASVVL